MAKAERFEDLTVWQDARALRKEIYAASGQGNFTRDFDMRGQIRSAALSAMSNIAEGFERGTNKEFSHFLNIAKGSVGEVRSLLYAAIDEGYLTQPQFEKLFAQATTVSRRCSRFITYLQTSTKRAPAPDNLKT
ncbi:MAG: four helix bundle protein [Verrucomicrobia bacterium]|nr:four helix bundle protein [Verrucomicrobiota bacterium]